MGRLRDKVILITGAAGGIGSAIAEAVVRNGGIAVATDVEGRPGIDHSLDVTSEADWQRVIGAIGASAGRLDGLVNSAGIAPMGTVESTDYALWRKVMAVNLDGTFLGCKYAMPLIRKTGGSIVNISSVSGIVCGHNLAAYNASKGGVRLLSKSLALHGARQRAAHLGQGVREAVLALVDARSFAEAIAVAQSSARAFGVASAGCI